MGVEWIVGIDGGVPIDAQLFGLVVPVDRGQCRRGRDSLVPLREYVRYDGRRRMFNAAYRRIAMIDQQRCTAGTADVMRTLASGVLIVFVVR